MRVLRAVTMMAMTAAMLATPAFAADKKADDKKGADKPLTIQLTPVALPVIVDDRLVNYVFVKVKLDLAPGADGATVRAKEPFLRSSLMRAGHHTPFTLATDYTKLDAGKIRGEMLRDSVTVLGPGVVRDVEIANQAAQRWVPVPKAQPASSGPRPDDQEPEGPEIIP